MKAKICIALKACVVVDLIYVSVISLAFALFPSMRNIDIQTLGLGIIGGDILGCIIGLLT